MEVNMSILRKLVACFGGFHQTHRNPDGTNAKKYKKPPLLLDTHIEDMVN